MEARYRRADGSWRYLLSRRVAERDASGRADRVRRRLARRDRACRAPAPRRGAGAQARRRIARRRRRHLDDDRRSGKHRLERADVRAVRPLHEPPHAPPFRQWLHESVHPDDRDRVRDQARAYFASGDGPSEIELRIAAQGRQRALDRPAGGRRSRACGPAPRPRRRHGRDRAPSRARRAARSQPACRVHHQPCRHRHVGGRRRRLRALERADVPPARPRAARDRAEPRGVDGARPSRRRRRSSSKGDAGCCGGVAADGLRVPRPPARRQLSLARVALGRRARRIPAAPCAPRRRQLGHHRKQERRDGAPAGGARASARSRPSRSSSRA